MKVLVSLSGGLDSTTALGCALESGVLQVQAISFRYPSKHNSFELACAEKIAEYYQVPWKVIDISTVFDDFRSNLLRGGGCIPEGHYEHESMKLTVVPARNIIFLSILAGYAESNDFREIIIGIHSGDHAIYPDCRPNFIGYMKDAIHAGTGKAIRINTPFLYVKKSDIIKKGLSYSKPVPYHLTRTCYSNNGKACGKCGSCTERREAFSLNNLIDPIEYES